MAKSKKKVQPLKSAKKPAVKAKAPMKAAAKLKPAGKPAKKTAKPVKAATKPPKKSAKTVMKASAKAAKKIAPKPAVKKSAKKPAKNAAAKSEKTSDQKLASTKLSAALPFATIRPSKKMDFSNFITPLDDRVMIQLADVPKKTAGGLYIPDTVQSVTGNLEGLVVSVGRGRLDAKGKLHAMDLKVGDKVMFPDYAASKIKIQDQDVVILRESDVLGVIG